MAVFTVYGNKEFGLDERMNDFEFFLAGVSRNVNFFNRIVYDFRALFIEVVNNLINASFVPRYRRSRCPPAEISARSRSRKGRSSVPVY